MKQLLVTTLFLSLFIPLGQLSPLAVFGSTPRHRGGIPAGAAKTAGSREDGGTVFVWQGGGTRPHLCSAFHLTAAAALMFGSLRGDMFCTECAGRVQDHMTVLAQGPNCGSCTYQPAMTVSHTLTPAVPHKQEVFFCSQRACDHLTELKLNMQWTWSDIQLTGFMLPWRLV